MIRAGSGRITLTEAIELCEGDIMHGLEHCRRCDEVTVYARTVGCATCMEVELLTPAERLANMALAEVA